MKLWILLALCAVVAAQKINVFETNDVIFTDDLEYHGIQGNNILVNALIRQFFSYIRHIINNGSSIFRIPPLDPLELEEYHLVLPTGIVNMDLHLKDVLVTGIGGFVVHRSNLRFSDLTFDLDISVPRIHIKAGQYDLDGDLFTAIPLYGKGGAEFIVEGFRFRALLYLKQSDDGKSILIDRIENPSFEIPSFQPKQEENDYLPEIMWKVDGKFSCIPTQTSSYVELKINSNLDGVIGGGDIDNIVNAIIQEVLINYVNRFQGAISKIASDLVVTHGNPILDQLDTWRFIAMFV